MRHTRYILAIDPGSEKSAYVIYDQVDRKPLKFGKDPNTAVEGYLGDIAAFVAQAGVQSLSDVTLVIEFPVPRGQTASWQLFDTCEAAGAFRAAVQRQGFRMNRMNRMHVKMHVCCSAKAKDPQVRQAMIDYFGGNRALQVPKCPECNGKGRTGWDEPIVDCIECGATGEVPGKKEGTKKKCSKCKGERKVKTKVERVCPVCKGTKEVTPGVLYGISADVWQALAVAITFIEHEDYKDVTKPAPGTSSQSSPGLERDLQHSAEPN